MNNFAKNGEAEAETETVEKKGVSVDEPYFGIFLSSFHISFQTLKISGYFCHNTQQSQISWHETNGCDGQADNFYCIFFSRKQPKYHRFQCVSDSHHINNDFFQDLGTSVKIERQSGKTSIFFFNVEISLAVLPDEC